jgi:hypothetical protein
MSEAMSFWFAALTSVSGKEGLDKTAALAPYHRVSRTQCSVLHAALLIRDRQKQGFV